MYRSSFFFSIGIFTLLSACQPNTKKLTVGYVQITQDPVLDAAKAGVFRALTDSGFIDGQNIRVLDKNAQGDLSMISMILQSLQSQNADLIITNSTPCMVAAAQSVRTTPVVFTVSFGPEQMRLKTIPDNLHGIFDPLRTADYVDLLIECIPGLTRIGIPYNNAEPNADYSAKIFSESFSARGITIITAPVNSSNDILQAGQYLTGQDIDALLVAADNTVYQGVPLLAKLAAENHTPLFVSDALQTEKGAAIGFGVNYEQWGYLSGVKAVQILRGRADSANRIEPILRYDLIINRKACAEQGLQVPASVRARATHVLN